MANRKNKKEDEIPEEGDELEEGAELAGEEDEAEVEPEEPSSGKKDDAIFVNNEKLSRAKSILELVSGKRVPRDQNEADRTEHYRAQMNHAGVGVKDKNAVRFLYELLGGLVRSESEQREADKKAAAMKAKNKKRAVQSDSDARAADR